jgi:hypothetical protein
VLFQDDPPSISAGEAVSACRGCGGKLFNPIPARHSQRPYDVQDLLTPPDYPVLHNPEIVCLNPLNVVM